MPTLHTAAHTLWATWVGMHQRCYKPDAPGFENYGGRGITVCAQWHSFTAFVNVMGERPEGHQLDRIDCNGPYSRKNCQWSSRLDNGRNKRNTVRVLFEGVEQPLVAVAEKFGIPAATAYSRYRKGWPLDQVLNPDVGVFKSRRKDLCGRSFDRLRVVSLVNTDGNDSYWKCSCSCGGSKTVKGRYLVSGKVRSCGCLLRDYRSRIDN